MVAYSYKQEAIRMLNERSHSLTLTKIAKDTGIPRGWISMFGRNKIDEPGYNKTMILYEYLKNIEMQEYKARFVESNRIKSV